MANSILPLTVLGLVPSYSASGVPGGTFSLIQIGSGTTAQNYLIIPDGTGVNNNVYWAMIFDRATLKPLVDIKFSTRDVVPPDVLKYEKDTSVFIVLTTNGLKMDNAPEGAWAEFLYAQGAGAELTRFQQLCKCWTGAGGAGIVGYIYVGVLGDTSANGFECASIGVEQHEIALSLQNFGTPIFTPTNIERPV